MHQRTTGYGRPSGTDGSDFSFRMVVDSRYKKVTQYKYRLCVVLVFQTIIQSLAALLSSPIKWHLDEVALLSGLICLMSIPVGELGRRRSLANFLKFYVLGSSIASLVTIASLLRNNYVLQVIKDFSSWDISMVELIKVAAMLLGLLIQVVAFSTTTSLIHNMAPPKRTS